MKTAIFLGAGASKADGGPLQNEITKEYFKFMSEKKTENYTIRIR